LTTLKDKDFAISFFCVWQRVVEDETINLLREEEKKSLATLSQRGNIFVRHWMSGKLDKCAPSSDSLGNTTRISIQWLIDALPDPKRTVGNDTALSRRVTNEINCLVSFKFPNHKSAPLVSTFYTSVHKKNF
jgi:hypothetical protein